jgi:hypothetical protein
MMYIVVAYNYENIGNEEFFDGPFIYKFDTYEAAEDAGNCLIRSGYKIQTKISNYDLLPVYYKLRYKDIQNRIVLSIEKYLGTTVSIKDTRYMEPLYPTYLEKLPSDEISTSLDKLLKIQSEIKNGYDKYRKIEFKLDKERSIFYWIDQTCPKFKLRIKNCIFWSDGEQLETDENPIDKYLSEHFNG